MSSFDEFTEAVTRVSVSKSSTPVPVLNRAAVLGGGPDACLIAALCLAEGVDVTLFSAYGAELDALRASSGVTLRGAGPVGTYQVDRTDSPSIKTTAELDRAVAGADVIFLTGPIHKQRTYAMVLADHRSDGQILVLAPGRSLGALETAWFLRIGGCVVDATIVEAQGLPYWVSAKGSVLTLSEAGPVAAATLPSGRTDALRAVGRILPNIEACDSVLASGFADGSALVEFPALLIAGAGGPVLPMGAVPLPENETFAALLDDEHHRIIARLASERRAVAKAFGVRNLPDDAMWTLRHAGTARGEGARPVPDKAAVVGLLRDGVIGSLVPLISAAEITGTPVPMTQAMITLAATVLGADVAASGRRLNTIGIDATHIDTARRAMDAIATGAA